MKKNLKNRVEKFYLQKNPSRREALQIFNAIKKGLESGDIRAAEKIGAKWIVHQWVKQAILLGFKYGSLKQVKRNSDNFYDKDTLPLRSLTLKNKIRLVPGGSAIRCGSYVAEGTVVMPPSYINIGSYVDSGSMVDSHVLVGTCAQIGKNVHLSAAVQIGGVLEPVGAMPVIIEDNVFIGGNSGIYEGVIVKANAVIASGVILNSSTPVFDATTGEFIRKSAEAPLTIPENAVVIPGSRPLTNKFGKKNNIQIYCPVIIKYRDAKTDRAVVLEDILR